MILYAFSNGRFGEGECLSEEQSVWCPWEVQKGESVGDQVRGLVEEEVGGTLCGLMTCLVLVGDEDGQVSRTAP
jgi:hypothetical protein